MGQPTEGGNAENAPQQDPHASQLPGGDDAPYVPRVFAFDPSVSAPLVDNDGGRAQGSRPEASGPGNQETVVVPPVHAAPATDDYAPPTPPNGNAVVGGQHGQRADATVVMSGPALPTQPAPAASSPEPWTRQNDIQGQVARVSAWSNNAAAADATQVMPANQSEQPHETAVMAAMAPPSAFASANAHSSEPGPSPAPPAFGQMAGGAGSAPGETPPTSPGGNGTGSPLSGFPTDDGKRRRGGWKRGALWTGVAVVILGGLYVGGQWYFSDKVPTGTTVAGVDIGGKSSDQAVAALQDGLKAKSTQSITVKAGDNEATIDPSQAGLTFDPKATVDKLTSFSLDPRVLWRHITGGEAVAPDVSVDQAKLTSAVDKAKASLDTKPVNGTVQYVDGKPTATQPKDGTTVDTAKASQEIVDSWLVSSKPVTLTTTSQAPQITQAKTDDALAQAKTIVSAPVTVKVAGQSAELPPDILAGATTFPAKDGSLVTTMDGKKLSDAVVARTTNLISNPDPAHFEFKNGQPVIVAGGVGTGLDANTLSKAVTTAAEGATDRTASVELTKTDPQEDVKALQKLGVKEVVSEFSTPLTSDTIRTKNIRRGLELLNGTLVKPGQTFSLLNTLKPFTAANGYVEAPVISDGQHVPGMGGGLSQVSTTTFNAAWFAGVDLVAHKPHSYWFTRYPAGRESTLADPSVDMQFKNDTPYGMLLQGYIQGNNVYVKIWSTKYYTVTSQGPFKSNINGPGVKTSDSPNCVPTGAGQPGFHVVNKRQVSLHGKVVKNETWDWTYEPDSAIRCTASKK